MTSTRWFSVIAALALCGAAASDAQARVVVGFGFPLGVPLYAGPPAYYVPPPYYYAPQYYAPQYYAPQTYYGQGTTFSYTPPSARAPSSRPGGARYGGDGVCQAGPYTCPLIADVAPGEPCSCPSHDGRRVRGRAY